MALGFQTDEIFKPIGLDLDNMNSEKKDRAIVHVKTAIELQPESAKVLEDLWPDRDSNPRDG